MWALLDADQEIPWTDRPLVLYHKYRFWVQPYDKKYHTPIVIGYERHGDIGIGSPLEYDVPKCAEGVPGCAMVNGTWIHTLEQSVQVQASAATMVYNNNHCHGGTCLSIALYACAKGTPLADCNATTGKLYCEIRPIWGGTGHPDISGTRFDEPSYIANPVCLWGSPEYGLEAPMDIGGLTVHMVKKSKATEGTTGEMVATQTWLLKTEHKMPFFV